jgi:hypothetical protein
VKREPRSGSPARAGANWQLRGRLMRHPHL